MRTTWAAAAVIAGAMAWTARARGAEAPAPPPPQRLDLARQLLDNRERRPEAVRLCEEIVADGRADPKEKQAAFVVLAEAHRRQEKWDEALKAADRLRQAFPQDREAERTALVLQADVYRQAKKDAEAVVVLRDLLQRQPDDKLAGAEARVRLARLLLSANKNDEALAEATQAASLDPGDETRVAEALGHVAEAAWRLGDMDRAAAALKRLIESRALEKRDEWQRRDLQSRYGQALRRLKRFDEARAYYAALEKAQADRRQAADWGREAVDVAIEEERWDDALKAAERVFTAYPDVPDPWPHVQRRIVDILVRKGAPEEALKAARICLDAATDERGILDAARLVAETFRAADKDLGRANAFIHFQRLGPAGEDGKPGTADDLASPLEALGYPSYPERERAFAEARKRAGDDARAMRLRALTYLYTARPKEALRCFLDAFARCGTDEFQAMGQDMILIGARAVRGHPAGLDAFFDFVNFGPAGPDGKTGTADDLADPFAPLLK